ncbi:63 kDa protein [Burkholderia pseudomallei 1710b]|uniref:63 kDa protein n=1 Tax=Burkholderia pseudomallei (strain 1710b) TaxID=320372 RepID=Q3JN51_BURP1|nr:63 kDa protein [Burkholderia pseudomallei 1710b]
MRCRGVRRCLMMRAARDVRRAPALLDRVLEFARLGRARGDPHDRLAIGDARQHVLGDLRQQRAVQDVIDVARARIDFGAAREHGVDERLVPLERRLVVRFDPAANPFELQLDDLGEHVVGDRIVRNHLHPAEERGLEGLVELRAQRLGKRLGIGQLLRRLVQARLHHRRRADVRGQDDQRVAKVDLTAFGIVHRALVEHLEEHLEHVRMRLLDFVEQHDRIRIATHRLRQHAALAVADVAGRRALQARHAVRLLILAHVDRDQLALAAVQHVGERERGLGLADARRPDEHEHAARLVRILEVRGRGAHALRDRAERMVLADHARAEQIAQVQHGLDLVLHHPAERNARPRRDDLRDDVAVDLQRHHRLVALPRAQRIDALGKLRARRVDIDGLAVGGRLACGIEFGAQRADFGHERALLLVARGVLGQRLQIGVAGLAQFGEARIVRGAARGLALECRDFRVDPLDAFFRVVDRRGRRAVRERDLRAGGVEHADRLVRQLAAADIAMRQPHRLGDRVVENAHVEVPLHQRRHPAQHRGGERLARLLDLHHLEAPRERRVLFEILLVLAPRRRRDRAQLAARERRLQQVRRIVLARLPARADDRVRLVDEENDRMRALFHLVDHALQAILELALHARARLQEAHVQHVQRDAAKRRRHVVGRDAQREPFDDGRLAHARLARHDRIVLPAAHQDVDRLADLRIAADHRVDLALARALREVRRVRVERRRLRRAARRIARSGGAVGHRDVGVRVPRLGLARTRGDLVELVLQVIDAHARELRRHPLRELREVRPGQQREQQVPRADPSDLRIERRDEPRLLEQLAQMHRKHRRARVARFQSFELALEIRAQRMRIDAARAQHERHVAGRLVEQREKQMLEIHFVVTAREAVAGGALGGLAAHRVQFRDQGLQGRAHR